MTVSKPSAQRQEEPTAPIWTLPIGLSCVFTHVGDAYLLLVLNADGVEIRRERFLNVAAAIAVAEAWRREFLGVRRL